MTDSLDARGLVELFEAIGAHITGRHDAGGALEAVTRVATDTVPGVSYASVTRGSGGQFRTVASTDPAATAADQIQYELGHGPCVDAAEKESVFRSGDLVTDERWPDFGPVAHEQTGVRSVLSIRLQLDEPNMMAGLNLYSTDRDAFTDASETTALLVATHGGLAVSNVIAREKATQLESALASNREIGLAMGVLMTSFKLTREQAFDLLRIVSQHTHRKLRDVATEVADTGTIELPDSLR